MSFIARRKKGAKQIVLTRRTPVQTRGKTTHQTRTEASVQVKKAKVGPSEVRTEQDWIDRLPLTADDKDRMAV